MRVAAYLASKHADPQSGSAPSLANIELVYNISNLDANGNAVIHRAVEYPELVKSLLLAISRGLSSLLLSFSKANCNADKVGSLLESTNGSGSTALHLACSTDSWQTVQLLLDYGAGKNHIN